MLGLLELLTARGFVPRRDRVKLVRHKHKQRDLEALVRGGWLETYQKYQDRAVFDNCDQIIVFIGEEHRRARFVGIYDVGDRSSAATSPLPEDFPIPSFADPDVLYYELAKRSGFEDLEDRVIIDWGAAPLAWNQWLTDREVVEVRLTNAASEGASRLR